MEATLNNSTVEMLSVASIRTDGGTQARAQTDWLVVNDYMLAMTDGAQFPPVVVFFDGTTHWLADGFHRVAAADRAGIEEIAADIRRGEKRDAILYACGANAVHGARRTNADKRRAVLTLLEDEEWQLWSDREIANRCGVSHPFVANLRPNPSGNDYQIDTPRLATRNGTTYSMQTANIGRKVEAPNAAPLPIPLRLAPIIERQPAPIVAPPKPIEVQPIIKPALEPAPTNIRVIHGDAQQVADLVTDPVQLVITSPPYNVGIEYDQHEDSLATYLPMLGNVWRGCFDVMEDGARICVVVPFGVGRNPYVPFDSQIMQSLQAAGFTIRGRIIWDKNTTGNRTSWGSFRMASSPALRDTTECVIVAHKGGGILQVPQTHQHKDAKGTFTAWLADSDYFMELAQDHWIVAPESAQRVGHPAPFPVELVQRLIHFYAYQGAHILDPFGGSGTTGVAAKRLGCNATLIDMSAEYCALAERRINRD